MKRIHPLCSLLFFIIVFVSCSKSSVKPNLGPGINLALNSTEQHQATADNAFTFNLLKTVQAADNSSNANNLFLSPLSVSIALGMTSNGANGATLDAIKNTMGFNGF